MKNVYNVVVATSEGTKVKKVVTASSIKAVEAKYGDDLKSVEVASYATNLRLLKALVSTYKAASETFAAIHKHLAKQLAEAEKSKDEKAAEAFLATVVNTAIEVKPDSFNYLESDAKKVLRGLSKVKL